MRTELLSVGIILFLLGLFLIIAGAKEVKWAFGGFIGPIPFGFASDQKLLWAVIALSLVVFLAFLLR